MDWLEDDKNCLNIWYQKGDIDRKYGGSRKFAINSHAFYSLIGYQSINGWNGDPIHDFREEVSNLAINFNFFISFKN